MSIFKKSPKWEKKAEEFEKILEEHFRHDLFEELSARLDARISHFNADLDKYESEASESRESYNSRVDELLSLTKEIEVLSNDLEKNQPDPSDFDAVNRYQEQVRDCNEKIRQQREMHAEVEAYRREQESQTGEIEDRIKERESLLKQEQLEVRNRLEALQRWLDRKGPENFYGDLNEAFIEIKKASQRKGASDSHREILDRFRKMRHELGEIARRNADNRDDGMLIVDAVICGDEKCSLLVDSGSSITTLSPHMVEALGLENEVGGEVELLLPAGISLKAPQLLIPQLTVQGHDASFVKGIVLKESICGVDGSLGQSFLNRFNYQIGSSAPRQLTLEPLGKTAEPIPAGSAAEAKTYDIFLSHRTEDKSFADEVYQILSEAGFNVFYSQETLVHQGLSDFSDAIDRAMEEARHMVVVGSCAENLKEPWVKGEWQLFDNLIRSGRKKGTVVSVLAGDFHPHELPVTLSRYYAFLMRDKEWSANLVNMLRR